MTNKAMYTSLALCVLASFSLTACGGTSLFKDKEEPRMTGERISVLGLQQSLEADIASAAQVNITLPAMWDNKAWPQAGGFPNHVMNHVAFSGNFEKHAWQNHIGEHDTSDIPLTTTPVVANGVVYTLDTRAQLGAFNIENGHLIWDKDLSKKGENESVIAGGVAYAHNTLFVTNGYDEVLAVSPDNGDVLWKKSLPAPSRAAPTVLNGRVFVSTIDSRLIALSAQNGSSLWEYTGISEMTALLGSASPAANNEIVIGAFASGELTALRAENGSVAWSDNLSNIRQFGGGLESLADIRAMPIIHKGLVFAVSFGGKFVAIDSVTGRRVWQRDIGSRNTPWIADNTAFVVTAQNELAALNIVDGKILWVSPIHTGTQKEEDKLSWNGPLLAGNRLIVTGSNGMILEISPENGAVLGMTKTKRAFRTAPVLADGTLLLISDRGSLIAYR